jgi:hypothetical protein
MNMHARRWLAAAGIGLMAAAAAIAADGIRSQPLVFPPGSNVVSVSGTSTGSEDVDYILAARGGEGVTATLDGDSAVYFNVLPPGSDDVSIFSGSISGERFEGRLEKAGDYRLRVYQMRASARRGEAHDYTLTVALDTAPLQPVEKPARLERTLELHGIQFAISSPNLARGNTLRIVPRGLVDDSEIVQAVDGVVADAEIADLNSDEAPEVYVYVRSADAAARMSLIAYASNRNRSLSAIHLPPIDDVPGAAEGYSGHDGMAVVESVFARRFPIQGGGIRQLQYRLAAGEASWVLKFDRMTEF